MGRGGVKSPSMSEKFDVVVIGGGTAGLVTASGCARLGRKVALIEREALGGDCLWTGCVPTKALVATARLAHQMRNADAYGLDPHDPRIDGQSIMHSMRDAQREAGKADDPEKFRKLGIEVIEGSARLTSPKEVEVNGRRLTAKDIVIATGSRTNVPPIDGLTDFLDHASFLKQDALPRSVVIFGGGPIGVEFAQILRRLGSDVTIVEMAGTIIPKEDPDVIEAVRQLLREEGIDMLTGFTVKHVDGSKVRIEAKSGETKELAAERIFVASGRRGNIEDLGLEAAGVHVKSSYIIVNKYLETTAPRIWACGDVHGGLHFTHVAAYEAVKLVRNMLFPGRSAVDYQNIPWAVFTDPEVAHIGLTEPQAREQSGAIRVYSVDMREVDRAIVERTPRGFVKFVCDGKGRVLGAHAFCANASTLIEEIVVARKRGMKIGDLAQLVSAYPSLADSVQKAASQYYQNLSTSRLGALAKRIAAWSQ